MSRHDRLRQFHDHSFGQDQVRPGERRTIAVIAITATMMGVEIVAGLVFGSMALLADGLHMASHAAALSIAAFAYVFARRNAHDRRFSFGTGKVNALGGFAGAVLLAVFALMMAGESIHRLLRPVEIAFNQAILVAVVGLVVNGVCVFILAERHDHHHDDHAGGQDRHRHDHNLRSAYLHVLADALTSVLAIVALVLGKLLAWNFMDPVMGIVGAILVSRWAIGLSKQSGKVLLDAQAPQPILDGVRRAIESDDGTELNDVHIWSIGPGIYAAALMLESPRPRSPEEYKRRIPRELGIGHITLEVQVRSINAQK